MKNSFKLIGLVLLLVIIATCKKDKVTEEEILTQHEQKIIDKIEGFMTDEIVSSYKNSFNNIRSEKDYALYLDSLEIAIDELKNAIQENYSLIEFEDALKNSLLNLESSSKGLTAGCNLRLGYAKGNKIDLKVSGVIGAGIVAGIQAAGGGGIKTVYDFVNFDRQVYSYIFCSKGGTLGIGAALGLSGGSGFTGINEVITGIRYHGIKSGINKFDGEGLSSSYSLEAGIGGGFFKISASLGIGTSKSAIADFTNIENLGACPLNMVAIENGTKGYSFQAGSTIATGVIGELAASYKNNYIATHTWGINGTYKRFGNDRSLAGTRMAEELIKSEPVIGIKSVSTSFDLAAAALAIAYIKLDFSNCPTDEASIGTKAITKISSTDAEGGGIITSDGGSHITNRGIVWSKSQHPTLNSNLGKTNDGQGTGDFKSIIINLSGKTTYYVRAYATNSAGTTYGGQESFTTQNSVGSGILFNPDLSYGSISDIDGNSYKTIQIGSQVWMAENLKTTKYKDGSSIQNLTANTAWSNSTSGAYCWMNNTTDPNKQIAGALYNWYSVRTNNLCPSGWHVPTDNDWKILEQGLGMTQNQIDAIELRGTTEGGKIKEVGPDHWGNPNIGGTNESGFSGIPGGYRVSSGTFYTGVQYPTYIIQSIWWSSTNYHTEPNWNDSWVRAIGKDHSKIYRNGFENSCGMSVRCIRDN